MIESRAIRFENCWAALNFEVISNNYLRNIKLTKIMSKDPYQIKKSLTIKNDTFNYYSLTELQKQGHAIEKLPFSIRILLENALRNFDDFAVTKENIETLLHWQPKGSDKDIPFKPARVLMQDFTGVPAG